MDHQAPSLSPRPVGRNAAEHYYNTDSDSYPGFTWLDPSMIVEDSTPDVGSADCSPKSSIAEPYTPSQFDAACIEQSPVACGSLQIFDSFSLSHLYRYSTFNFNPEDHINDVLRGPTHPLEEEDLVSTSPVSWTAAVEDSDIDLGQGMTATPTGEDDDAPVRMSIKSLDIGEEPVFDLPSGWRKAFVSP